MKKGSLIGPFFYDEIPFDEFFLSPLTGIWKIYPNKVSLIQNLSAPKGNSINSSIPKDKRKTEYVSFYTQINLANSVGIGGYLGIIDLEDSYFNLPIIPHAIKLFGSKWYGKYIFYACNPFGLATAPKQFQIFADVIKFILETENKNIYFLNELELLYHYLDDFFFGHPKLKIAMKQFNKLIKLLKSIGIPTSERKCTTPRQIIIILGFLLDTITQTVSIPDEKIKKYIKNINDILNSPNKVTIHKIDVVDGQLRHCSQAMYGGAAYLRGLEKLKWRMKYQKQKTDHQPFKLDDAAIYDLEFWLEMLPTMKNKVPFRYILKDKYEPDIIIYTDASEKIDCKAYGGIDSLGHFFNESFLDTNMKYVIASGVKLINLFELIAVVAAIDIHKDIYQHKSILIRCDNENACNWIITQRAKFTATTNIMVNIILKYLFKLLIKYKIYISVKRIASDDNVYADKLSRLDPFWFKYIQYDLIGWKHKPQPSKTKNIINNILKQFEIEKNIKLDHNFQFNMTLDTYDPEDNQFTDFCKH